MATAVITGTEMDPGDNLLAGVNVVAQLYPPGELVYGPNGALVDYVSQSTVSNSSGAWSLTLERTDTMTPAGMVYLVTRYNGGVVLPPASVKVPAGGGVFQALWTSTPGPVPPGTGPAGPPSAAAPGVYNVVNYGADPTGVKDSTTALASAASAALTGPGGIVEVPPGTYIETGWSPAYAGKRLKIQGAGQASKLTNTALSSSYATTNLYLVGSNVVGADWIEVADLYLEGNSTGGMGLVLNQVNQGTFRNLRIADFTAPSGWGVGLNIQTNSFSCLVENPVITGCSSTALFIQNAANANTVIGGWLYGNQGSCFAVRIASANGNALIGVIIQGVGTPAAAQGGVELTGKANRLYNCWIEGNSIGLYAGEPDSVIDSCYFSTNATDIEVVNGCSDLVVRNCHFETTPVITLGAGSLRTVFEGCTGLTLASITDNSGGQYVVRDCPGINPVGVVAVAVPLTGVAVAAAPYDRTFYVTDSALGATIAINGVTVATIASGATVPVFCPAGATLTPTYTTAPTWTVYGD